MPFVRKPGLVAFPLVLLATTAHAATTDAPPIVVTAPANPAPDAPAPVEGPAFAAKDSANPSPAAPIADAYPLEGAGDGVTAGGYNQSRWAEDWSRMRDPKNRNDPIDRLKFLPLDQEGDSYLTFSGELRLRMNHTTNPNLRESDAQRQDIVRAVVGADLHVGDHIRAYAEVAHGGLSGVNLGTPSTALRNDLVFQQYFIDVTGNAGAVDVGVRYGRQTFADGPNLMVVPRDNNTIFYTLNGVRAWARGRNVRADIFDFRTTRLGYGGTGDDISDRDRRFTGISTGVVLPRSLLGGSKLYLDPFVWRLRNNVAVWGPTTAREAREYYGLHLYGDAGRFNLDWTVNHQRGEYDGRPIRAWQAFVAQTYRLGKERTAPRIGLHADYATGGGAYGTGTLRTAFSPFGNNVYYSYQLFATPTNLIAVAPSFTFNPVRTVRATMEYQYTWRDSVTDAVYRANGSAFAGTERVTGRRIGQMARAQIVWTITPRLSFTGRYEHLEAGPALTRAGYRNSDFLTGWLSFRF